MTAVHVILMCVAGLLAARFLWLVLGRRLHARRSPVDAATDIEEGMAEATIKWGVGGAIGMLVIEYVLTILERSQPQGSLLRESVHSVSSAIVAPVVWFWRASGVRGEAGLRFLLPMLASNLLYLVVVGFLVGAGLGRLVRRK